jgi:hypothetical protein
LLLASKSWIWNLACLDSKCFQESIIMSHELCVHEIMVSWT